ncbi:MAG: hypothetical protein M1118_09605 [Chloroflexi bacterium]|nr:hypothetical protein [Chloroflexota bacterium]
MPASASSSGGVPSERDAAFPLALLAEVDRLATRSLWPNYDPRTLPVAIYDGRQTWLSRHPDPPPEFTPGEARLPFLVYPGLHPAVRANSSVTLHGHATATVLLDGTGRRSLTDLAALVIHELFHVYQRQRRPDWTANEADLFVYPMDDADLLHLRHLETAGLRQALHALDPLEQASWAAMALGYRRERFERLPSEAIAYERGNELQEGLARYVDGKARGDLDRLTALDQDFPADGVRERTYAVGRTLALLLDRLAPGWQDELEAGETRPLDVLLATALARLGAAPAVFTQEELAHTREQAQADVTTLQRERSEHRKDFFALPGWQVVIRVEHGESLWPQGFDPSNIQQLGDSEVLHTRWLRLGNTAGSVEVLGWQALTEAAGIHPLFTGVRTVTIAGLPEQLVVRTAAADAIEVTAVGVTATFRQARLETQQRVVVITIKGNQPI